MKKVIIYTTTLFTLAACEKQTSWNLQTERSDKIVVEGMITNESKAHSIRLSFPVENLNDTPLPVTGATVSLKDNNNTYYLMEQPVNSGIYITSSSFFAVPDEQYTLTISYKNNVYTATTLLLPGRTFNPLQYVKNPENDLYHISYIASPYNGMHFAIWNVILDWSGVQGYQNIDPDSCKARMLFYTLPTIDVGQVFSPAIEKISFPAGTLITEKRYSITSDHAEYIRAMLSETNWSGGFFDSSHSNIPTNLSEGAIGYFSACGVETLYLSVIP